MDVEHEVKDLKRRVSELESDAKGEKTLVRRVFEAVRDNQEHILAVSRKVDNLRDDTQKAVDDHNRAINRLEAAVTGLRHEMNERFEASDRKFDKLRDDLPNIIASAVVTAMKDLGKL